MKVRKQLKLAQAALAAALKPTFFDTIPMDAIHSALSSAGFDMLDEDGSEWQGMLCGPNGSANIQLGIAEHVPVSAWMKLMWYRMPSNRIEVIAYIG